MATDTPPRKVRAPTGVGNRGKGRKAGVPNKVTAQLKDMILGALDKAGGEQYLVQQARENPGPFMTLLGKVLPTQLTGKDGGPIEHADKTPLSPEERMAKIRELNAKLGLS